MQILDFIVQNREFTKAIYALMIILICVIITKKSDRIFRLSSYKGIQYFRNAFFFYGIAFALRYFLRFTLAGLSMKTAQVITNIFFEFFLIMAGFFLLYSLLWKRIESPHENTSSLLNLKVSVFYLMTILLVGLDYIWNTYFFLFVSQIVIFAFVFAISFSNYQERGRNRKFLKFYSFSMFLALIAWILNALAGLLFNWNPMVVMIIYLLNIIMFLIFLFGIINVTKRN
jgi:hypothetical protein